MNFTMVKLQGSKIKESKGVVNDISIEQLEKQGDIIGVSESQLIEWVLELHGETIDSIQEKYIEYKNNNDYLSIKELRFIQDVVKVEYTSEKQFVSSFIFNEEEYVWLASKGSAVNTYIRKGISEEIIDRLNNGRNMSKKFIPAKLNAYHSLALSSSKRVTHQPQHVVVVHDNKTSFESTYTSVTKQGVQKGVTEVIERTCSDGNGVIDYKLLNQWSKDLGHDYESSGMSIRNSFMKGMLFPVDLQEFFSDYNVETITDVWGKVHDVKDVDVVMPTSMFKLWDSYKSYEEYEENCRENSYGFRVCIETHDIKMGRLNYQQTTDLHMTDEQIRQLITPTIDYLQDICGRDRWATTLYLNGQSLTESSTAIKGIEQALMIEPRLINEKSVVDSINKQLERRKQDTCLGKYNVESDFQVASSDLFHFLCSTCGIEHNGLLKAGEVFSMWHSDRGHKEALIFRSPMISKENVAKVKLADSKELRKFYKHMKWTVTLNDWDILVEQLCGQDFDGDKNMLVTDKTLLEVFEQVEPVKCEAVKGAEKVVCDNREVLMQGAILGCDESKYNIGTCIDHITSMYSVRSKFDRNSEEYKELEKRILMGIMISQGYIDFRKNGSVVMELPKKWYNLDFCENDFERSICADKKPYFLVKYQPQAKEKRDDYREVMEQLELRSSSIWGLSAEELLSIPYEELDDTQRQLVDYWSSKLPTYMIDNSTQHRMCKMTESMLKEVHISKVTEDCSDLMKNKHVAKGDKEIEKAINTHLTKYDKQRRNIQSKKRYGFDYKEKRREINRELEREREFLKKQLVELCDGDSQLALNCFINTVNKRGKSHTLIWYLFTNEIVENLLELHNYEMKIPVPVKDDTEIDGEVIEYQSRKFIIKTVNVKNN